MPYDHSVSRVVSHTAFERLKSRANALPRLAVAGEFSSGKSTLLNLLLGQEVLPTRSTATALPSVWISYGDHEGYYVDAAGSRQPLPEDGIESVPGNSRFIRLYMISDFLKGCEVIDLSGLADPERPDSATHEMLSYASFAIWCSPATQAWRQSERAAWLTVPSRIRANSILAVTRMDKLTNELDRQRVMNRVRHETSGLFSEYLPVSAYLARQAVETNDDQAWQESGIDRLVDLLSEQVELIRDARSGLLERYVPAGAASEDTGCDSEDHAEESYAGTGADEDASAPLILSALSAADPAEAESDIAEAVSLSRPASRPAPLLLVSDHAALPEVARREAVQMEEALLASKEPEDPDLAMLSKCMAEMAQEEVAELPAATAAPAPVLAQETAPAPASEGDMLIPGIEAAMARVLSGYFARTQPAEASPAASGDPAAPAEAPHAARIWREIVAQSTVPPEQMQIVSMIEALLTRMDAGKGA